MRNENKDISGEPDFSVIPPEIEYNEHEDTENKLPYPGKELFRDLVLVLIVVTVLYLLGKH